MGDKRTLPAGLACETMVARTPDGWFATPAHGRDPVQLSAEDLTAMVRATAGEPLRLEQEVAEALVSSGPSDGPGRTPPLTASPWNAPSGRGPVDPLPATAWIWPADALVGRVTAGCLLTENGGRHGPLDEVDIVLLDGMDDIAGMRVRQAVLLAQRRCGSGPASDLDLRTRLRRLADIGAVRWQPDWLAQAEEGVAAGSRPQTIDLRAGRVRHHAFPGRTHLQAVYRRWRPSEHPGRPPDAVAATTDLYVDSPRVGPPLQGRVPVYAPFQTEFGPVLALAMLTAYARHVDDGGLNRVYEIRRTEDPESMLADLAGRSGPAIVLCSNYLWSHGHNLALAHRAAAIHPDTVFIHGGPHTPTYADDCARFFAEHGDVVDITVRAEGEITLAEVLAALAPGDDGMPSLDLRRLDGVRGITYRDPVDGRLVTSADRDRITDLDQLPSPYLTGELDHLRPEAFTGTVTFETNRGCPYGCTFCDWGSSTLSRIRKFSLDRVQREMAWAGERGLRSWVLGDANLGIMSRDVEVVDAMVAVRRTYGVPMNLGFNVAKNTTKHLTAIMDRLVAAGIGPHVSLALQTTDVDTLEAIRRTNINTDHYVALAASFRRRGLPLQADLMLGLPGQTVSSFSRDLQFLMEHEVPARIWVTQLLPNSPMNAPDYREQFEIAVDGDGMVVSSSTFSAEDKAQMKRLRHASAVLDRFGLLRHVMRHLQWDHGIEMIEVLRRAVDVSLRAPDRYPLLNWSMRYFDHFGVPPLGWRSFYAETRRFVVDEFGVPISPPLETVFRLQEYLMPEVGRLLPDTIVLDHDYVAYFRAATEELWTTGHYTPPIRRLDEFGPARFTIYGDRLDLCARGMRAYLDPRNDRATDEFWVAAHLELDSPLVRNCADVAGAQRYIGVAEQLDHAAQRGLTTQEPVPAEAVSVALGPSRSKPVHADR